MKSKFAVGDRVRKINYIGNNNTVPIGTIGVVVEVLFSDYRVLWDDWGEDRRPDSRTFRYTDYILEDMVEFLGSKDVWADILVVEI